MDIIFFAAIALFLFFKLKNQFGKVDEDQKRDAIKKFLKEQADLAQNQAQTEKSQQELDGKKLELVQTQEKDQLEEENNKIIDALSPALKKNFTQTLEKSKISANDFIKGAIMAFEMVIQAFSSGNKETLKTLLNDSLYKKFAKAIDDRAKNNTILNTNVISIDESSIKSAKVEKNEAIIKINFISKQISYVLDNEDKIIQGDKNQINEISDVWTFSRNINSKNPNWIITSTKS